MSDQPDYRQMAQFLAVPPDLVHAIGQCDDDELAALEQLADTCLHARTDNLPEVGRQLGIAVHQEAARRLLFGDSLDDELRTITDPEQT